MKVLLKRGLLLSDWDSLSRRRGCGHGGQTEVGFVHGVHRPESQAGVRETLGIGQGLEDILNVARSRIGIGEEMLEVVVEGAPY